MSLLPNALGSFAALRMTAVWGCAWYDDGFVVSSLYTQNHAGQFPFGGFGE